jgi:tetratricopeptide (TPR) repeat protein
MDRPELGVRAASVQERWARYWRRVHPDDDRPLLLLAEAVYNRAIAVERMGDLPGSIRLYSSVIREFEGFRNSLVGTLVGSVVAKALVNKGNNLGHLGDWEAGFKCHKRAIVLYGKKIDPWFDEPLEKAFASVIGEYTSRRQDRSLAAVRRLASRRRHRRQVREWSPQNKGGG